MSKRKIFFADLTHTAQGISAATFPLGASFVLSYAKQELDKQFDFRLFKFPSHLEMAIREDPPIMLCFSNYSWNFELAYKFASLTKARCPDVVIVFGGPNFPTSYNEKIVFLQKRSNIDFYIELEGELGFVELVRALDKYGFNAIKLKAEKEALLNTNYVIGDRLVTGLTERVKNLDVIPSPYLTGILDEFFEHPIVPMIETTRGCPFSCTFCADGIDVKSKVYRFRAERTRDELHYIANRVRNIEEIIITDLNFAMYKEDLNTAYAIAEIQEKYKYPVLVSASAGKNKPHRIIDVAGGMKGWTLGASIQSTDPEVLKAIKRSNISSSAYRELVAYGNSLKDGKTHSEIILGLPGDTKEKHFESLRFGIGNGVNHMRMFQAIMLVGTEMASQADRAAYGLVTKFRTIPGCVGTYNIFGKDHAVAEVEEIIVGSKTLPFEDYLDCRVMNLVVETFYNNAIFDEVFSMVRTVGGSVFDCLLYLKEHPELYTARMQQLLKEFLKETSDDLFDGYEQAKQYVLDPKVVKEYLGGDLGTNELLLYRALLFVEFEDISDVLFNAVKGTLFQRNMLTRKVEKYLDELRDFMILRKADLFSNTESIRSGRFSYDFEAIRDIDYKVDPNCLMTLDRPVELFFFHNDGQKEHIANQMKVYANTPIGLGRLIQRCNLKLIYRTFARLHPEDRRQERSAVCS